MSLSGQNPFSAMMTKYVKKPAAAWISPIWPYERKMSFSLMRWSVSGFRGFRFIRFSSDSSKARLTAGSMSVPRSMQRTASTPRGSGMPAIMEKRKAASSATLEESE